jgi:pilus assembly protein CpaE
MDTYSAVMAVISDEADQAFFHQVANALGYSFADIVIGTPADAAHAIAARPTPPRYIIVDVGEQSASTLDDLDFMAEACEPGTRVVALGLVNDVNFYRELRARGVLEYFTRPAKVSDVRNALMQGGVGEKAHKSQTIAFMSAASGDGASTIALNVAYSLASDYKKKVVLVDMDFQFGMVAKNLDLNPQFGIKDLIEHPDRGVDATLITRMITPYNDVMKIIAAPNDLRMLPNIAPELVRDLLTTLAQEYDCVVIDLPHIWSMWVYSALANSSHIVMVAQLWLRSVTHSARLLKSWRSMGVETEKINLLINRSGAKFKEAVGPRDFERVCDKKIGYYINNNIRTVVAAENQGKTIAELGSSDLAAQIKNLAGSLIGVTTANTTISKNDGGTKKGFSFFSGT